MTNKDKVIEEMEKLINDSLELVKETLAFAKRSFYIGIFTGIGITSCIVLTAKWYYS